MADGVNVDLAQALADTHWQMAKGSLRAVVAVQGARLSGLAHNEVESKYEKLNSEVESFIEEIERLELHL